MDKWKDFQMKVSYSALLVVSIWIKTPHLGDSSTILNILLQFNELKRENLMSYSCRLFSLRNREWAGLKARLAPRLCGAKARFHQKRKKKKKKKKKCLAQRFLRNCVFKNAKNNVLKPEALLSFWENTIFIH